MPAPEGAIDNMALTVRLKRLKKWHVGQGTATTGAEARVDPMRLTRP